MNLTTQNIKENFTPHELYTIVNNYLEDDEFIKPTNDYLAELQKESLQELKIDLDVLNSFQKCMETPAFIQVRNALSHFLSDYYKILIL